MSAGRLGLRAYFDRYVPMAVDQRAFWKANSGYDRERLAVINRVAIAMVGEIRAYETKRTPYETKRTPIVISGCIGPRGGRCDPGALMRACEAEAYHWQVPARRRG